MEEGKTLLNEITAEKYDAADRPFDFVESDAETALICEPDENVREKISGALKNMGYQTTEGISAGDALKFMRFHLFDLVMVNENFDQSAPDRNDVLAYLETLAMSTRRQIFVALISNTYRTTDNMAAFNKSVNTVINLKNIDDVEKILRGAVAENAAFYRVMRSEERRVGKE